ncbi:MAG: transposase, partial [Synergistaceae bacterium]|nr:transposase [Synergistaceae bacterium]
MQYHFVWITKYRYKALKNQIAERLRDIARQGCEAKEMTIISG